MQSLARLLILKLVAIIFIMSIYHRYISYIIGISIE